MLKPYIDPTSRRSWTGACCARGLLTLCAGLVLAGCAGTPQTPPSGDPADVAEVPVEALATPEAPVEIAPANERLWQSALSAIRESDWTRAEVLLQEITVDQPELAGPWVNLGQVYAQMQRPDDAEAAYLEAVRASPRNCAARNRLGVLSRKAGDFASAEAHYLACVEGSPQYKDAYLNLGILYELYLGKLEDALASYRRYQELSDGENTRVAGWVMDLERRLGV